jgi:peptidoglycan-associated lipoprotein
MKRAFLSHLGVASLILLIGATGCKHPQKGITPLSEGSAPKVSADTTPRQPLAPSDTSSLPPGNTVATNDISSENAAPGGGDQAGLETFEGMVMDPNYFATQTVHFDFDSSVVKLEDIDKVHAVGDELKLRPNVKLLIDGHCDERGTEEYNRALGSRRALAVREVLVQYGIAADRIRTRSWGEDKPVDPGHNEAAWAKNRRAEFILLLPPTTGK